jgi:CheY-like chemotaxis protein
MAPNDKSRLVLIVEDDWLVRDLVADEFRSAGWEVAESSTAEHAIDAVRGGRPVDVVFTDIQLAGDLTGWDVGEQCRELRDDIAIIYTSGNAVDRSRSVDGSLFFQKPYRAAAVVQACNAGQGSPKRLH